MKNLENDFYYVGIGASAGGLEALKEFFTNMPDKTGMAFIIIQHLSPDYKSLMDELLARHTKIPIQVVRDGMVVKPDNIYLIPPKKNLSVFHGKLFLEDKDSKTHLNLPIDIFLRSLAVDKGKKAIAVILSGTGSDGTLGLKSVKEAGGMIMVQDEKSAKFDGMPKSSISTGIVDYILKPGDMYKELINYIEHPLGKKRKEKKNDNGPKNIDSLTKIIMLLRDYSGIDFSYYKENTIIRRIERRIKVKRYNSTEEYIKFLKKSDEEKGTLYREMLIGVTGFFRDKSAFEQLEKDIIPKLDYSKKTLRVWSSGCSTGEEVYSIAILLQEYKEKKGLDVEIKIFGTDIDKEALDIASKGYYPDSILSDVKKEYIDKYFIKEKNGRRISEKIRNLVVYAKHNVLKDPPFSKLDLIICRNLFIYIKPEIQQKVMSMFYYSLNKNGYLMLGSSESLGNIQEAFETINSKNKLYKYKEGYKNSIEDKVHINNTLSINPGITKKNGYMYKPVKFEKLILETLNKVLPPSIVLDDKDNIIHVFNDVSDFLSVKPGRFSTNISSNVSEDLSIYINNIVRRLKKDKKDIIFEKIIGLKKLEGKSLTIEGKTINLESQEYYLLSFKAESKDNLKNIIKKEVKEKEETEEKIQYLENELKTSRETLQATVEELETSNEELQSSNEELIASNEELQSTNEELQSVNEELFTVNSEYQIKIDELVSLNNDLDNLIKNTQIGALYIDRKLHIRRITPVVSKITNIMSTDIGRPISHISASNYYPDLIKDINKVVEDLKGIEKEIKDDKGNYWLARIRPFRTEYNSIEGVIVTFVDINNYKDQVEKADKYNRRIIQILKSGRISWWEWDIKTNRIIYDDMKAEMLGYKPEEFPNDVYEVCDLIHPEDYDDTMETMRNHLQGKTDEWKAVYRIRKKDGSYGKYYDRGKINRRDKNGNPIYAVGVVINISDINYQE
ncbi:MAG: CheR family methyltransferase [Eubacteriales bacterium]